MVDLRAVLAMLHCLVVPALVVVRIASLLRISFHLTFVFLTATQNESQDICQVMQTSGSAHRTSAHSICELSHHL